MVLALFVDGLGLADAGPANPITTGDTRTGDRWRVLGDLARSAVPLDACLDTPGLPQSSTGQVTLFTGFNAARHAGGRHLPGFPGPMLRPLIAQGTFYDGVVKAGGRATFLNAFGLRYLKRMVSGDAPVSATTLAAVSAGLPLRVASQVGQGRSVYHDITGEGLIGQGETVLPLTPERAAAVALDVALEYDLTLFEFFLTDIAGHSQDPGQACDALARLDRMLAALVPAFMAEQLPGPVGGSGPERADYLVLFSDHGNIEDLSVPTHTRNPVPLAVWSPDPGGRERAQACTWLGDVAGLLLALSVKGGE